MKEYRGIECNFQIEKKKNYKYFLIFRRCTMRIQSNEKSEDLFNGANELLIESVRNLMKVVNEEREYLKQQGFIEKLVLIK